MRHHEKHRAAFSLIELLVVLAILAILLVVVVPGVGSVLGSRESGAASDQVASVLQRARLEAQSRGTYVWVGFSDESGGGWRKLSVAAVGSKDGSGTNVTSGNLYPVVKPLRLNNIGLVESTDLAPEVLALDGRTPASDAATNSGGLRFSLSGQTFSNSVVFSPQGAVLFAAGPDESTAYEPWVRIGLGAFRGATRLPQWDAILALDGASGLQRILRRQ